MNTEGNGKSGQIQHLLSPEQLTSHAGRCCSTTSPSDWGSNGCWRRNSGSKRASGDIREGQAIGGLVYNLILGGEHLSDLEVLRGDPGTQELLGVETILAPTTAGSFCASLTSGTCTTCSGSICGSSSGCGPISRPPPARLIWIRASMSKPPPQRGLDESLQRGDRLSSPVRVLGRGGGVALQPSAPGQCPYRPQRRVVFARDPQARPGHGASSKLRADSGFYSKAVVEWCEAEGFTFTITADQTAPLLAAITALPERRWRTLPEYALAEVAELRYQPTGWASPYRYVVKREVAETKRGELYWKYHAPVTNEEAQSAREVGGWHLQHADYGKRHQGA